VRALETAATYRIKKDDTLTLGNPSGRIVAQFKAAETAQ